MFQKKYLSSYIQWGIIAALGFIVPMIIYLKANRYSETWYLFLGNGLFLVAIAMYMLRFRKMYGEDTSTQTLIAAGHIATFIGIVVSCVVAAIALPMFIPDIFTAAKSDSAMADAPSQMGTGATNGLVFSLFMCAIIGNVCGGSFASIILPYTSKKNQTKDRKSEVLNN